MGQEESIGRESIGTPAALIEVIDGVNMLINKVDNFYTWFSELELYIML